eukprot:3489599-Pleurochrysis_carterae.AAC.1
MTAIKQGHSHSLYSALTALSVQSIQLPLSAFSSSDLACRPVAPSWPTELLSTATTPFVRRAQCRARALHIRTRLARFTSARVSHAQQPLHRADAHSNATSVDARADGIARTRVIALKPSIRTLPSPPRPIHAHDASVQA